MKERLRHKPKWSDEQKLREAIAGISIQQGILTGVLQAEMEGHWTVIQLHVQK